MCLLKGERSEKRKQEKALRADGLGIHAAPLMRCEGYTTMREYVPWDDDQSVRKKGGKEEEREREL